MIGRNVIQPFHTFKHIRKMTEHILYILFCLIRYISKQPKGSYVHKYIIIKSSNITRKRRPIHRCMCCHQNILRNMQTVCKIIRRSSRDITNWNLMLPLHHPRHNLIDCSVSTTAHDKLISFFQLTNFFICISVALRRINCNLISGFYKNIHNIRYFRSKQPLSGIWIIYK